MHTPAPVALRSHAPVYLVLKNIPEREWSFALGAERRVLGSSRGADIPIPPQFTNVSRRHAELWTDRHGIWVRDLGSRLGTNVNGVWVDHVTHAGLVVGDGIWFGGIEVYVVAAVRELSRFSRTVKDDEATSDFGGEVGDRSTPDRSAARQLSQAEIDILLWLSRGYEGDVELGKLLYRSPHTVHTEMNHIYHKLGIHSRSKLLAWLIRCRPM